MKTYAIGLEAPTGAGAPGSEELSLRFYEHFDGLISDSFGRLILRVYVENETGGVAAARCSARKIRHVLGVRVERVDRDPVDAAEISRRVGRPREDVLRIVHGLQHQGEPFPAPMGVPHGRPLWEWAVVNEWLRRNLPELAEPEHGLSRDEMVVVDRWLALEGRTASDP